MTADLSPSVRRIGLLVPSSNTIMEPDFCRNVPSHWSVHTARMYMEETTAAGEARMLDEHAFPAARDLATARPDVIVFGCTSAGALRGNDYDAWLVSEITQRTGIPVVSVIKSVREALLELSAKRLAEGTARPERLVVATPYIAELNDRIRASLEADGSQVLRIHGLGITENFAIARVSRDTVLTLAREAVGDLKPDALFVSCTNFPAMSALSMLRERFPFPVITSNQAAWDAVLRLVASL